MPPENSIRPTGVKSRIVRPVHPLPTRRLFTIILVDVPISVTIPPRIAAHDKGINSLDAGTLCLLPQSLTNGIIIATTGVLFMKAELPPTKGII